MHTSLWRRGHHCGCSQSAFSCPCWSSNIAIRSHTLWIKSNILLQLKTQQAHIKCSKATAVSLPTWQGALIFRQVEDFMKRASLGVVSPSAFLLTTNPAWHPSRLSATCYRWLDLLRGTSKMINLGAGCVNKAPGSCVPMKDQCYLLPPHQIKNRINPRSALEGPKNSTHVGEACQLS